MGDRVGVIEESADLVYNLAVLWAEAGVTPDEVWAEMDRRERMLGIAEKLPKQDPSRTRAAPASSPAAAPAAPTDANE